MLVDVCAAELGLVRMVKAPAFDQLHVRVRALQNKTVCAHVCLEMRVFVHCLHSMLVPEMCHSVVVVVGVVYL